MSRYNVQDVYIGICLKRVLHRVRQWQDYKCDLYCVSCTLALSNETRLHGHVNIYGRSTIQTVSKKDTA